jgi:hypothetical protein
MCHAILTGALVGIRLQCPVGPQAHSLSSAAHGNHVGYNNRQKIPNSMLM